MVWRESKSLFNDGYVCSADPKGFNRQKKST